VAQLSDDALAFGGALSTVDEVVRGFRDSLAAVPETESVALAAACGRVLARDLVAPLAIPAFDNSAVDGYAVRIADVAREGETRLRVVDRVAAGARAEIAVGAGEAARVFTGAPMPPGTDTVFMQEDVRREGEVVIAPPGLRRGANARRAGEDLACGAVALAAGRRLRPEDVGLAAALGFPVLEVRRRLVVAVISTGDEVTAPGEPLGPAGLYDANRPMLLGLVESAGATALDRGIVRDEAAGLSRAIAQAAGEADVILTSGGVSTGEEDHVKTAVERAGRLVWWRIGIKPGRPVAMGVVGGAAFLGLPGNPVAAFVTFTQIVRPLLAALAGEAWRPPTPLPVTSAFAYRKKAGRREFVRVRLEIAPDGRALARKHPQDGAGVLTSLTMSDGLVVLPEASTSVGEGEAVGFLPFAALV
jgi:molybdopterin molybdotransferase